MSQSDRIQLFDNWAEDYDRSVESTAHAFPFDGYERVLDQVVSLAAVRPSMQILDLGIGTGNLAKRFVALGCDVWGVDFSAKMLAQTRIKLPQVKLVQADLLGDWPAELAAFDRIVCAYVLHEFDLAAQVNLLHRLACHHLSASGHIIVADIAFATAEARQEAHQRLGGWDEDEHYWAADEAIPACEGAGLDAVYTQISSCGGIFVIKPTCKS